MSYLPIIFCCITLSSLLWGIGLLTFFTKRDMLQKALIVILLFWAIPIPDLLISLLNNHQTSSTMEILGLKNIILGTIGFFSLISYPIIAIYWKLKFRKISFIYAIPILLSFLVYFAWHILANIPINIKYYSFEDLYTNLHTPTVILRLIILLSIIIYDLLIILNIWNLIPIYRKHSQESSTCTSYNIAWIRRSVFLIIMITPLWFLMLFKWESLIVQTLFFIGINTTFISLILSSVFHQPFNSPSNFNIDWKFSKGWFLKENQKNSQWQKSSMLSQLDEWMYTCKPFTNCDFCANDVYEKFPNISNIQLSVLLSERSLNFQSYVRKFRIEEACNLIKNSKNMGSSEIAFKVGYNSLPAFNRAFHSVMGKNPTIFKKEVQ